MIGTGVSVYDLRDWCPKAWYDCVGSNDKLHLCAGTRIESVRKVKESIGYMCKAPSKVEIALARMQWTEGIGLSWGKFNESKLPKSTWRHYSVDANKEAEFQQFLRDEVNWQNRDNPTRGEFHPFKEFRRFSAPDPKKIIDWAEERGFEKLEAGQKSGYLPDRPPIQRSLQQASTLNFQTTGNSLWWVRK